MSKEKKRLGRGLEYLLSNTVATQPGYESSIPADHENPTSVPSPDSLSIPLTGVTSTNETDAIYGRVMKGFPIREIALDKIDPNPFQPRSDFNDEELQRLADNIREYGLLQPITLRTKDDRFQLIAGERRLRAYQKLNKSEIPAYVLVVDDRGMAELALSENLQRKDLNAIEKATAFRRYLDVYGGSHEELAQRIGLDRSTVTNLMRLLDLPLPLQQAICKGDLTQGHARALLPLEEKDQFDTAKKIQEEGWSVRQTEIYVHQLINNETPVEPVTKKSKAPDVHLADLEQQFRSVFGPNVRLTKNDKGGGKLVIPFRSNEEFERIYEIIHPKQF